MYNGINNFPGTFPPGNQKIPATFSAAPSHPSSMPGTARAGDTVRFRNTRLAGDVRFGHMQPPASVPEASIKLSAKEARDPRLAWLQAPRFLQHGTSTDGNSMNHLASFLEQLPGSHPVYSSYVQEVEQGTGIAEPGTPGFMAADSMAARDMGDFRCQLIGKNMVKLEQLRNQLDQASPRQAEELIGNYFDIVPELRPMLTPIIRPLLIDHVLLGESSLRAMVNRNLTKLDGEVEKLNGKVDNNDGSLIYSTHWFHTQGAKQGKALNWDSGKTVPDAVNPRIISLRDVDNMEQSLVKLENSLTLAITRAFTQANTPADDNGRKILEETARNTARRLVNTLSPAGVAMGHSQGGPVLASALLNAVEAEKAVLNGEPVKGSLGGRFIQQFVSLDGPMQGLSHIPELVSQAAPMMANKKTMDYVWKMAGRKLPATAEVRPGSQLMERIGDSDETLDGSGRAMLAFAENNDRIVEPGAAVLKNGNLKGGQINVVSQLPPVSGEGNAALFLDNLDQRVDKHGVLRRMMPFLWQLGRDILQDKVQGIDQHWAPLVHLRQLFYDAIGGGLVANPKQVSQVLDTKNAELFRLSGLRVWDARLQKSLLNIKEPARFLQAFRHFHEKFPEFLPALLENAREGAVIASSAPAAAVRMLSQMLDGLQSALATGGELSQENQRAIAKTLSVIANAKIAVLGKTNPVQQANNLLDGLSSPVQAQEEAPAPLPEPVKPQPAKMTTIVTQWWQRVRSKWQRLFKSS